MAFPIENFLSPNLTNMLITLVIPFLIIFGLLLFALRRTRVLGNNPFIYVLISLGLTIMIYAIKPDVFNFLASYLFQIGIAGSIIALGGVVIFLFFGVIRWGAGTARKLGGDEQKLKDMMKEEEKLMKRFHSGGLFGSSVAKRMEVQHQLDRLEKEKRYLLAKMRHRM